MFDLSIWATSSMKFGIFMLCYGLIIGAAVMYGSLILKARRTKNTIIDELCPDESP